MGTRAKSSSAACAEAVTAGKVAHGQNYEPYSTSKEGASRFEPKNKKKDIVQLGNAAAARASGARGGLPALGGGLPRPEPPAFFEKMVYFV